MGKGNRTRNTQYQDAYAMSGNGAVAAKRQPQKKDRTATIVLIAIVALLALSLVLVLFSDSGIKERNTIVVSSENYEVTGTMMSYYQNAALNNMYMTYVEYFYNIFGDINYAYQYAQQYMQQASMDQFFEAAVGTAKQYLVLCEAADAAGIKLDDEDRASIEETIKSYGGEFTATFGSGVKAKDVRRALELQALAGKYYEKFEEDTRNAITDEDIAKYIEDHKADFYAADLLKYTVTLKAEDYGEDTDAYEAAKTLADTYLEKLEKATSTQEFNKAIVEYIVARDFESTVTAKVSADLKPDAETAKVYEKSILDKLIRVLVNAEEEEDALYKEGTLEKEMEKVSDALEATCATALASLETSQAYVADTTDETILWMINPETAVNTTKVKTESDDTKYSKTVYMMSEVLHVVDEETVNVGHILVEAKKDTAKQEELDAAKAKAEELLATYLAGEKTKDAFEKLAQENTKDSGIFYDNVTQGRMTEAFDEWIFSDDRKEVGETGIVQTEYGYHVMYWNGEGENTSITAAKNGIVSEKFEAFVEEGEKALSENEKYIAKNSPETEAETK